MGPRNAQTPVPLPTTPSLLQPPLSPLHGQLYESEWKARRSVVSTIAPGLRHGSAGCTPTTLFDRNYEDAYADPGHPALRRTAWGTHVLARLDGERKLLMRGAGASPQGSQPFLDVLEVDTGRTERLWRSSPPYYETASSILSDEGDRVVTLDGLRVLATRSASPGFMSCSPLLAHRHGPWLHTPPSTRAAAADHRWVQGV